MERQKIVQNANVIYYFFVPWASFPFLRLTNLVVAYKTEATAHVVLLLSIHTEKRTSFSPPLDAYHPERRYVCGLLAQNFGEYMHASQLPRRVWLNTWSVIGEPHL